MEIHCAHGYLIAQFLSYFIDKRTDEYGGCFDSRCRFFDEIYAEVRKNIGDDFPVTVRMSVSEYVTGGRTEAESYALARHFDELGVDAIHVSNGVYASDPEHHTISNMLAKNAFNRDAAGEIKKLVHCPVILVNKIVDPHMADTMLEMGKADFIAMGRESMADPYYPTKVKEGRFDEINYCIGCLQGCEAGVLNGNHVTCLVNPRCVNEVENKKEPVKDPKNVMIIGAGPAGLMAARTAAELGHHVSLYDKNSHFGGTFRSAAYPMGKGILSTVCSGYRGQCEKLGVTFHMSTEVTEDLIRQEKPDVIIIATGSRPLMPCIPGITRTNVVTAEDVLLGNAEVKDGPVIVCGGGVVGETAEFIAQTNHDVMILEMKPEILSDMFAVNKSSLVRRMNEAGIRSITITTVPAISDNAVTYKDAEGNNHAVPASTVVSAFGYRAYNPLEETARKYCSEVKVIGSAVKAGNALTAIKEGYQAGLNI